MPRAATESRVPLVDLPEPIAARVKELGGRPINLYRALANEPEMLAAWVEFAWAIRLKSKTPRRLRELMILRCAQIARVDYELIHHIEMAKAAGIAEELVVELPRWKESTSLTEAEKAALRYTESVMSLSVSDGDMAELRRHFSDAEVVELTVTAATYAMVPRMLEALSVPLEDDQAE